MAGALLMCTSCGGGMDDEIYQQVAENEMLYSQAPVNVPGMIPVQQGVFQNQQPQGYVPVYNQPNISQTKNSSIPSFEKRTHL